jgi:hypothetical protein
MKLQLAPLSIKLELAWTIAKVFDNKFNYTLINIMASKYLQKYPVPEGFH